MSIKMRGLLKGLTYISHIFEASEQEQELQIGAPTDVKHVAHIGWDGPNTGAPSWMSQYKTEGDSTGVAKVDQQHTPKARELKLSSTEKRHSTEYDSPLESPSKRCSSTKARTTRRQMTAGSRLESPRGSPSDKQTRTKKAAPSNDSSTSEYDPSSSAKGTNRRKKTKALSTSSSKTSSKMKGTSQLEATAAC